ncbi:MAG TPA: ABC transporter permease [Saprospiraceae bacterium]|nr:ABC transporter permease [Saprospiraceae bacterium]
MKAEQTYQPNIKRVGILWKYPEWLIIALLLIFQAFLVGPGGIMCVEKSEEGQCVEEMTRPIAYDPGEMITGEKLKAPLTEGPKGRHWMGTDHLGRDVAAGWLRGLYYSFTLSLIAGIIAILVGLMIGGLAAYYGNRFPINHWSAECIIVALAILISFVVYHQLRFWLPGLGALISFLFFGLFLSFILWRLGSKALKRTGLIAEGRLNLDQMVMTGVELFESIPALLIMLTILSMIQIAFYWQVGILLGIIGWTTAARFARSEGSKLLYKKYIRDLQRLGLSDLKILWKYILPSILPSLGVVFSYSIAAFILAESFLSFLGIGLPGEFSSWGRMLNDARRFPQSWWLGLFPVLGIFLLVWAYHRLARQLEKKST